MEKTSPYQANRVATELYSKEEVIRPPEETLKTQKLALNVVSARNYTSRQVEVEVYNNDTDMGILKVPLKPNASPNKSIFKTSVPYTLIATTEREGKKLVGRVEVHRDAVIKIEFLDKVSTMTLYALDDKKAGNKLYGPIHLF